jgi:AcrR family transcriptional regulator
MRMIGGSLGLRPAGSARDETVTGGAFGVAVVGKTAMTEKSFYHKIMAYDVVKTINGRDYRYRVQSERDEASGKRRNRWTYVGRVASERSGETVAAHARRGGTRLRLLAAAQRLLSRVEAHEITVDAIATEAGVAHGTFYRYFQNRASVLEALAAHIRETRGSAEENLRDDVASAGAARSGLRAWIDEKLRLAVDRPEEIRTWFALMTSDPRLIAFREERRAATVTRMTEHFAALTARGFANVRDPAATAFALYAMIDGIFREAIVEGHTLGEARIVATADVVEHAIFGH